jgi:creatinine deaminase
VSLQWKISVRDPPLYRKPAAGSVDDPFRSAQRDDQEDEEQDQEEPRQKLRDRERRTSYRRESEERGHQPDHQKYDSHVKHCRHLPAFRVRNTCRAPRCRQLISTSCIRAGLAVEAESCVMNAFLDAAVEEAERGRQEGGIPIGAVLVHNGRIVGRGHNRRIQQGSAVLHGEMDALERAGRLPASVYRESTMYTTLSPCSMCSGAILLYGIPHVIVGENRTFRGEEDLLRARDVRVDVVQDERCIQMMEDFIAANPDLWNEDIGK